MQARIDSLLQKKESRSSEKEKSAKLLLQTRSDIIKKNLLLLKALNQTREINHRQIIYTESIKSKESDVTRNGNFYPRILELKETIRTQRLQLQNLLRENNDLHNDQDEHLRVLDNFNRVDQHARRMITKNTEVKGFW